MVSLPANDYTPLLASTLSNSVSSKRQVLPPSYSEPSSGFCSHLEQNAMSLLCPPRPLPLHPSFHFTVASLTFLGLPHPERIFASLAFPLLFAVLGLHSPQPPATCTYCWDFLGFCEYTEHQLPSQTWGRQQEENRHCSLSSWCFPSIKGPRPHIRQIRKLSCKVNDGKCSGEKESREKGIGRIGVGCEEGE